MFGKLKNLFGGDSGIEITAPVAGKVVALEDVPDPTFAQGILGPGIAIEPTEGRIVAPADGTVDVMFETGHAVSLTTAGGAERRGAVLPARTARESQAHEVRARKNVQARVSAGGRR